VLVTEWLPESRWRRDRSGTQASGDQRGPHAAGQGSCIRPRAGRAVHADPHGQLPLTRSAPTADPDDPGEVAVRRGDLAAGSPAAGRDAGAIGSALRGALAGNADEGVAETLRAEGFFKPARGWTRRLVSNTSLP